MHAHVVHSLSFRKAAHQAVDRICDYFTDLETRPVTAQVERGYLASRLPNSVPVLGEPWDVIMRDYEQHILQGITHWQHPMFFGFFPANTTYEGILADMFAAMTSNPGFNWNASPAVTELEFIVVDWVAQMLGLSTAFHVADPTHDGGGILFGSASESTLTMAIAARERALQALCRSTGNSVESVRDTWLPKLVMYCSDQAHSSGVKTAHVLGLRCHTLRVKREDDYALRGATLREAIESDLHAGYYPFYLVSTYGTTNTCAVDRLDEIAAVAHDYPQLWLHVDAAYGGVTLALPEMREATLLNAINEHFDSFSTNLHKWGLVPFESSPAFARHRMHLAAALTLTPEYLKTQGGEMHPLSDLRNMQISLGRRFRALKVWFVLRSYGIAGFQAHLRSHISLAQSFAKQIVAHNVFETVCPPRWGLVVFRIVRPDKADDELDRLNRAFQRTLSLHTADIFITPTVIPGVGFCFRWALGAPGVQSHHVDRAVHLLHQYATELV